MIERTTRTCHVDERREGDGTLLTVVLTIEVAYDDTKHHHRIAYEAVDGGFAFDYHDPPTPIERQRQYGEMEQARSAADRVISSRYGDVVEEDQ